VNPVEVRSVLVLLCTLIPKGVKYFLCSGPDTLYEDDFLTMPIPGNSGWILHAYASSSAAWTKWYWTYSNPDQALKQWMELHPEPWVRSRQETLGKNWMRKVFTGTHERMEDHQVCIVLNLLSLIDSGNHMGWDGFRSVI
jgi:hypothetical protein